MSVKINKRLDWEIDGYKIKVFHYGWTGSKIKIYEKRKFLFFTYWEIVWADIIVSTLSNFAKQEPKTIERIFRSIIKNYEDDKIAWGKL